jgi:COMPASS component BRE2
MLVRGASATPEGTPTVSTPPAAHKRKHAAVDDDGDSSALQPTDPSTVVLSRDSSRPRLTVSRHPVFIPSTDGSPFHLTDLSAVNRQLDRVGFKYAPAGLADPGAAIPYRTIESQPMSMRVSWEDRSPSVRVTQDGLGLASDRGFRSARSNVGVQEGRWYMEVRVDKGGGDHSEEAGSVGNAHVRLGWGRREAPLNGPVGLDGYSYGMRDKTGEKVTLSRPRPYGRPFGTGDVVGLYISLPPRRQPNPNDPEDPAHIHRERIPIDFKGQEYFESLDYPQCKELIALMDHPSKTAKADPPHPLKKSATVKNLPNDRARIKPVMRKTFPQRMLPTLPGSKIAFFINGECQGIAFQDIYDYLQLRPASSSRKAKEKQRRNKDGPLEHTENHFDDGTLGYYPFFSLFGGAQIHMNPGPNFAFPPPPDVDALLSSSPPSSQQCTWRPMSERYPEFMAQQWALDVKEEAEYKAEIERNKVFEEQEEKKRIQKERKRKTDAARRKRKAEEKRAATVVAVAPGSTPIPDTSATLAVSSVSPFAPSIAPSATVDMNMENVLLASAGFAVTRTPTPNPVKHEQPQPDHELDALRGSFAPQTPPSSDLGGHAQLDEWQSDGQSDDETAIAAREFEVEAESVDQQIDRELTEELVSSSRPPGFQEYSARWIDP